MGFFKGLKSLITGKNVKVAEKYQQGLAKSKKTFKERFNHLFARYRKVDEDFLLSLEELLIESDIGARFSDEIIENISAQIRLNKIEDPQQIVELLVENLYNLYQGDDEETQDLTLLSPHIILVVGVNGVGKTTSIAKLANNYLKQGKKVLLVAGDTFRAGAVAQLEIWAKRLNIDLVKGKDNGDPASVVYEGVKTGIDESYDIVICDTAGRLHTKQNLMNELGKINRIIAKLVQRDSDETLLVIDATMGQNGIYQAKAFKEATDVSNVILTKMDGTSRGGIILALKDQLNLKVKYLGVGEQLDDLIDFDINDYLNTLFSDLLRGDEEKNG